MSGSNDKGPQPPVQSTAISGAIQSVPSAIPMSQNTSTSVIAPASQMQSRVTSAIATAAPIPSAIQATAAPNTLVSSAFLQNYAVTSRPAVSIAQQIVPTPATFAAQVHFTVPPPPLGSTPASYTMSVPPPPSAAINSVPGINMATGLNPQANPLLSYYSAMASMHQNSQAAALNANRMPNAPLPPQASVGFRQPAPTTPLYTKQMLEAMKVIQASSNSVAFSKLPSYMLQAIKTQTSLNTSSNSESNQQQSLPSKPSCFLDNESDEQESPSSIPSSSNKKDTLRNLKELGQAFRIKNKVKMPEN